jgi:hypothetical protein
MTVERGRPWERAAGGPSAGAVTGDDAALAAWAAEHPGARVTFTPYGSDLARALGLAEGTSGTGSHELGLDGFRVEEGGHPRTGVNLLAVGTPPDRFSALSARFRATVVADGRTVHDGAVTSVVVASGQFLRGADVVPRGHPGDGRLEVQVYRPRRGAEAGDMRRRLATGTHVPHPRIVQVTARAIEIRIAGRRSPALELDGRPLPTARELAVSVVPAAFTLLV